MGSSVPPLKDIMMASLIVHFLESHWNKMMELHRDLEIELQKDLN